MAAILATPPLQSRPDIGGNRSSPKSSSPRGKGEWSLNSPRISVVIVNYCQWEQTAKLVRQIQSEPRVRRDEVEIVIVDNHSPGDRWLHRLRRWPGVSLRRWGRNRGFARAVNEGCRLSQGAWFLVLNPDITLGQGFLEGVLNLGEELTRSDPRAGIVGFRLLNPDGTRQLSGGPFPSFAGTLARLALPRSRRKYHRLPGLRSSQNTWVTGCCMLLRRECWEDLGGLDPRYFLYYEDVDLCRRAREGGWTVVFEPGLKAVHHSPLHSRPVPTALRLVTRHSLLTYAAQHWPAWQFKLLTGIVLAETFLMRAWAWWKRDRKKAALLQEMDAMARELAQGQTKGARSRLQKVVQVGDIRLE